MEAEAPLEFAEVDPTGRYGRYDEILGKGSTKTVYRAFDELRGTEVAWNQVKLHDFLRSPEGLERLYSEIHLLRTLHHPGIMRFHDSWVDASRGNVNFVTEMFTSGTLRQYRHRHRRVRMAAVKHWCRQILEGLAYLHAHDPPIIHRDLKCDNIFVNGNQGEVKIGDLGLAAVLRTSPAAARCVGTPEFMAPEVYEEQYNELVDIYSFGMCVLEMVTLEYPYSECNHYAEIYKKVTSGRKPKALYKVRDPEVRRFIDKCLASMSNRLSARELLEDPFLRMDENLGPSPKEDLVPDNLAVDPLQMQPSLSSYASSENRVGDVVYDDALPEMEDLWGHDDLEEMDPGTRHFYGLQHGDPSELVVTIKGKRVEDGSIFLRLRIIEEDRARNIYFQFNIEFDTALTVATEMVAQLEYLANFDVTGIAEMIDGELSSLMPDWKPGPGIEEISSEFSTVASHQEFASRIASQMCSSNYVCFSKSNGSILPSSHGDSRGQFLDGKGLLRRLHRSSSELPHSLDRSGVCSPISKENNSIAQEDRMNSSFKKCEVTFLQKSSSKAKGRFLCGSFRKVSMDLSEQGTLHQTFNGREGYEAELHDKIRLIKSEQGTLHRTFNGREGYEAELHDKIRLINLTHQLQPQKYQNDHIERPLPVSLSSLSVNVADSAGTSNPERLSPADCNEANPASICASSSSELPQSSRRRGISMRHQRQRNRNEASSRLVQNDREKGERGSMRIVAARKMLAGFLLPGCLPRSKSLKVDAINP